MTGVVPEGLTFDAYHPSMAPLFTALADEARVNGKFSEWEHMSAAIGFPSMEELGIREGRTARYRVPVSVTLTITREVYIDVEDVESEDNPNESDFISNHREEIEAELPDLGDYDSIVDIEAHPSDYIQFDEWVDD